MTTTHQLTNQTTKPSIPDKDEAQGSVKVA